MKFRDYIHEGTLVPSSKLLVKEELKRADGDKKRDNAFWMFEVA